jgi:DHA1 family inner membrane transport protein
VDCNPIIIRHSNLAARDAVAEEVQKLLAQVDNLRSGAALTAAKAEQMAGGVTSADQQLERDRLESQITLKREKLHARILNHGAFFGVGSIVAASVVAPDKRAGAVAAMFMGLTLATIGGVPLAAWFGEVFGWRTAFWGITGLGVLAMAALWFALPNVPLLKSDGVLAEIRVLGRGTVLAALALTVIGSSAMFTVFTYIARILSSETQASTAFITAMLVLYGIGLTLGNMWGGKAADRSVDRTLIVSLSALILVLLAFTVLMRWPLPAALAILIWGIASFAIVPPLQMRVMEAAQDAPNLASAVNIGAFNLGNAMGAALGGAVINAGLGYPAISLAGAAMAGLGLLMVLGFAWRSRETVAAVV